MKDLEVNLKKTGMNRELFILEAVYTNGLTHIPVTRFVKDMVRDNRLNIL